MCVPPDFSPGSGAESPGACFGVKRDPSLGIRFVGLGAGGQAEKLPLIPACEKALVEINTVVLVEVPCEMQPAVSMEMPSLRQWSGASPGNCSLR